MWLTFQQQPMASWMQFKVLLIVKQITPSIFVWHCLRIAIFGPGHRAGSRILLIRGATLPASESRVRGSLRFWNPILRGLTWICIRPRQPTELTVIFSEGGRWCMGIWAWGSFHVSDRLEKLCFHPQEFWIWISLLPAQLGFSMTSDSWLKLTSSIVATLTAVIRQIILWSLIGEILGFRNISVSAYFPPYAFWPLLPHNIIINGFNSIQTLVMVALGSRLR